ncbi:MAG: hypothetical protein JJE39_04410 [Vicinamibacteria bacterium]|nr:hypothetical protein [Vicinamibacteria bacterium]
MNLIEPKFWRSANEPEFLTADGSAPCGGRLRNGLHVFVLAQGFMLGRPAPIDDLGLPK